MIFQVSAILDQNHPVDGQIARALKWCDQYLEPHQWFTGAATESNLKLAIAIYTTSIGMGFPIGPDGTLLSRDEILSLLKRMLARLELVAAQHNLPSLQEHNYSFLRGEWGVTQ